MVFKYTMKFIDDNYDDYEVEGIIFAENFRDAADKLIEAYGEGNLMGYKIDFVVEDILFEF